MKIYKEIIVKGMEIPSPNPYSIYFVYPKHVNPIVIKGRYEECEKALLDIEKPFFYRRSFWNNKENRGSWMFSKDLHLYVFKRGHKYLLEAYNKNGQHRGITFRRMPHRWVDKIEELYRFTQSEE